MDRKYRAGYGHTRTIVPCLIQPADITVQT
jgi:hypothetical protein